MYLSEVRKYLDEESSENAEGTILDDSLNEALQHRWSSIIESGWDSWTKRCMAQLFENERRHIDNLKKTVLAESTMSGAIPDIVKFVFPTVRDVWSNLISNNLFSVQPMNSPVGGIFYWKYLYGTTKGNITAGTEMIRNFDPFYTSEYVHNEPIGAGPNTTFTGTLTWKPVKPAGLGQVGVEFVGIAVSNGAFKTVRDSLGTGAITGDIGSGTNTIVHSSGVYNVTFSESVTGVVANYFFDMEASSVNIPQVNVSIELEAIKAISRKVKLMWSSESTDDMRAVMNMEMEPQLTSGVVSEIALGIDREMIMTAYGCGTTNVATFDASVPPGKNQVDHFRNILTVVDKVSGEINTRTHRGAGNFIITSPGVAPIFSALSTHGDLVRVFQGSDAPISGQGVTGRQAFALPQAPQGYGVYPLGFLQSRWIVIIDPYFPAGKILVGLKGPLFNDSGLIYAPYVPLQMTTAFLDPADFSLRKGMRTRYTKKLVNPDFYGIVTVTNLP